MAPGKSQNLYGLTTTPQDREHSHYPVRFAAEASRTPHPLSFILHPLSFILHPLSFRPSFILYPLAFILFFFPSFAFAQDYALLELSRRNQHERHQMLLSHGINTDAESLQRFLESGFPESAMARGLPSRPTVKSEVVNTALQELGYLQSRSAVPVLVKMLEGQTPPGADRIIMRDVEILPLEQAQERRELTAKILRLNAIVALGLIGDKSAADAIRACMDREVGGDFVSEGAIALALLEDPRGLQPLLGLAKRVSQQSLRATYATVFYITGRNYGVTEETSIARRKDIEKQFEQWLATEGASFKPSRADVLRRRSIGYIIPPPPMDSLRGLLKGSRTKDSYDTRYAARQRLQMIAQGARPELEQIATDPMEDIDIRRAAMDWLAAANPKEARSTIRSIARRDENPDIRERAEVLLDEIDIALRNRR
jgi:HEAT repeat protein